MENVAPQARGVASNLYDRGAQSGQYVRQYVAQEPLAAMLIAGVIGFALGYLIHGRQGRANLGQPIERPEHSPDRRLAAP